MVLLTPDKNLLVLRSQHPGRVITLSDSRYLLIFGTLSGLNRKIKRGKSLRTSPRILRLFKKLPLLILDSDSDLSFPNAITYPIIVIPAYLSCTFIGS